jgi:hypothetical protein
MSPTEVRATPLIERLERSSELLAAFSRVVVAVPEHITVVGVVGAVLFITVTM